MAPEATSEVSHPAHQAMEGALEGFGEVLEAVFGWIIPIVLIIVGIFAAAYLGGAWMIANAIYTAVPAAKRTTQLAELANVIGSLIMGGIWIGAGGAAWHVAGKKSDLKQWVLRPIAGFLIGLGIGFFFMLLSYDKGLPKGIIDTWSSTLSAGVAQGLTGG